MLRTLATALLGLSAAASAAGDVRLEETGRWRTALVGETMTTVHSVEYLSGLRVRRETSVELAGGLLGAFPKQQSVVIERLDREVFWTLDPQARSYREGSMAELASALSSVPGGKRAKVRKASLAVTGPRTAAAVNGFSCARYDVLLLLELEDLASGARSTHEIEQHAYLAPPDGDLAAVKKARDDALRARWKAMELSGEPSDALLALRTGLEMAGVDGKELLAALAASAPQLRRLAGFPVAVDVKWTRASQPSASGSPAAPGTDPMGALAMLLGGAATTPGAPAVFLSGRHEVAKAELVGADEGRYEVPAGYSKLDAP